MQQFCTKLNTCKQVETLRSREWADEDQLAKAIAEVCDKCEDNDSSGSNVSQDEIQAAMDRYPGYPLPLALAKYKVDQISENELMQPLQAGLGWGGIHLERVGVLVQKLVDAMYHSRMKAMTITIQATDFPDSYDHIWVEVKHVESGTEEEISRMGLAGWPCCACDKVIAGEDTDASAVMLNKIAKWDYPSWGNVLYGTKGRAVATLCGVCTNAGMKPLYALKRLEGSDDINDLKFERVPLAELEDADNETH